MWGRGIVANMKSGAWVLITKYLFVSFYAFSQQYFSHIGG
jgi:hypothetical protein